MGRQVKRVPLDFNWPLNKVYEGFIMPDHLDPIPCSKCNGSGYSPEGEHLKNRWYGYVPFDPSETGSTPFTVQTPEVRAFAERNVNHAPNYYGAPVEHNILREAKRLSDMWNLQWSHHLSQEDVDALIEGNRLWDFTRTWSKDAGWQDKVPPYRPTAEEVNRWSLRGIGHDSINQSIVTRAYAKRHGIEWLCSECEGEGSKYRDEDHRTAHEAWESVEPPTGEGYQLWENVSEGSPVTPVFPTPEGLAQYLAENGSGIHEGTFETWLNMIAGSGYAPSVVMQNGVVESGTAIYRNEDEEDVVENIVVSDSSH